MRQVHQSRETDAQQAGRGAGGMGGQRGWPDTLAAPHSENQGGRPLPVDTLLPEKTAVAPWASHSHSLSSPVSSVQEQEQEQADHHQDSTRSEHDGGSVLTVGPSPDGRRFLLRQLEAGRSLALPCHICRWGTELWGEPMSGQLHVERRPHGWSGVTRTMVPCCRLLSRALTLCLSCSG